MMLTRLFCFMQALVPFATLSNANVGIFGEISIADGVLLVQYQWQDPQAQILISDNSDTRRQDGLWQTTCFEAFLQPVGDEVYYEINIAPTGGWNAYHFIHYRQPQPPGRAEHVALLNFERQESSLKAEFSFKHSHVKWQCSLTAVIELYDHSKHYFALKHVADKPDFHRHESFILGR